MHTCQFSYLSRNETAPLRFDPVASWFLTQCCRAPLLGLTQWRRRSVLTQCCRAPAPAIHLEPFLGTNPSRRQTSAAAIFLRQIQPFSSSNPTFPVVESNLSRYRMQPISLSTPALSSSNSNLPQQPCYSAFCRKQFFGCEEIVDI